MFTDELGYQQEAKNADSIVRARTTGQVRAWDIPRTQRALRALRNEFSEMAFPSVYALFVGTNGVYVGEAKDICVRLKQHMASPETKISSWERALVINDGRPATQSNLSDEAVRKALELFLLRLFKANRYKVLSQGETLTLNAAQTQVVDSLAEEIIFMLKKNGLIKKGLDERGQEEVPRDELKTILQRKGKNIQKWAKYEAVVDGAKVFIRPGSCKPNGWQITFRGRKPGSPIDALQRGDGYLLVARDGAPLIPLTEVQKVIQDNRAYEQDTIDIWVVFGEGKITLRYKSCQTDVTHFRLRG